MTRRDVSGLPRPAPDRAAVGAVAAIALIIAVISAFSGVGQGLEHELQLSRDAILRHPASGKVGLVEIDARSLKAFNSWPWPRGLHARAIAALDRAGAAAIAFDAEFSANSLPGEDAKFARAIAASHTPVYLPTFRQASSQGSDAQVENLPLPQLREHAQLASVNIAPDADGLVRSIPYGVITAGVPRPSMAAMLAGASGNVNRSFAIDGAIDESTIPRISFADLVEGRVPASAIRGRSFLIGATAVEMGDRYALPGHGVVPGALLQLLGVETLLGHSIPVEHGPLPGVLALFGLLALRRWQPKAQHPMVTALWAGALLVLPLGLQAAGLGVLRVVPALLGLGVLAIGDVTIGMLAALRASRLTDAQTGLPNARALRDSTGEAKHGHIMVLRIANYSDVLNVLGQDQTALLIQRTAQRLSALTAQAIHHVAPNALGWFDPSTGREKQAEQAEAGAALFTQPLDIDGRLVRIIPAIGIAPIDGDGSRALDRALMGADQALAEGARWGWHSAAADVESDWRLALSAEVEAALASGAISVVYQPQYDIAAGTITAAEALVRWEHPTRGPIPPENLIALVEEHGLIGPFTLHVLKTALEDRLGWARDGVELNVAVNVSALLPGDSRFIADVEALLTRYPAAAAWLTLEVTESAAMIHTDSVVAALERLAALGITISIDDYGTGQSTLSYLKNLPTREIKIDKSFVVGMEGNRSDQLMVRSTIALAHELGYRVVAEGVETATILDLLAQAGCDVAQGWHIGRPMSAQELAALAAGRLELAA